MAINVKVNYPVATPIRFSSNATPIVIKNDALIAGNQLKNLEDVVMQDPVTGNILVYNSTSENFILEAADNINISNIDGGNF